MLTATLTQVCLALLHLVCLDIQEEQETTVRRQTQHIPRDNRLFLGHVCT